MKPQAVWGLLGAAFLIQLLVPIVTVVQNEQSLGAGMVIRVPVRPFDPYDPFRGRYVNLTLQWPKGKIQTRGPVYGVLKAIQTDGWEFSGFRSEIPEGTRHFVKLLAADPKENSGDMSLTTPPVKFYLQEDLALWADKNLNKLLTSVTRKLELEISVLDGDFQALDLWVDGLLLKDFVRENPLRE